MKLEKKRETEVSQILNRKCSPKSDLFEVEGILDDTRGGDAHSEDVLLRRQVIRLCYSVYVRQVAGKI